MRLFCKREPSVLFYNASGFIISAYSLILKYNVIRIYHKSCWRQLSYCGLHVRAVSVFGKKSDAACGFLAYFCAVLRFLDPPYAPLYNVILIYIVMHYQRIGTHQAFGNHRTLVHVFNNDNYLAPTSRLVKQSKTCKLI